LLCANLTSLLYCSLSYLLEISILSIILQEDFIA